MVLSICDISLYTIIVRFISTKQNIRSYRIYNNYVTFNVIITRVRYYYDVRRVTFTVSTYDVVLFSIDVLRGTLTVSTYDNGTFTVSTYVVNIV